METLLATFGKNENAASAETQEAVAFYSMILPYGHCCQDTKTLTLVNTPEKTLLRRLLLVVVVDHHSSIYDVFFSRYNFTPHFQSNSDTQHMHVKMSKARKTRRHPRNFHAGTLFSDRYPHKFFTRIRIIIH